MPFYFLMGGPIDEKRAESESERKKERTKERDRIGNGMTWDLLCWAKIQSSASSSSVGSPDDERVQTGYLQYQVIAGFCAGASTQIHSYIHHHTNLQYIKIRVPNNYLVLSSVFLLIKTAGCASTQFTNSYVVCV